MVVSAGGGGRWWLQVVLRCWQALGAPTSSEVSSVEARYSLVTSMRTRDALRSGELTPRKETGPCHAETTRDADIASILERARRWIQRRTPNCLGDILRTKVINWFITRTEFIKEERLPKRGHSGTHTRDALYVNAVLGSGVLMGGGVGWWEG